MAHVVTLNAGSSSVKFALFDLGGGTPRALATGLAETIGDGRGMRVKTPDGAVSHAESWQGGADFHADSMARILAWCGTQYPGARIVAAGHRVVHGGLQYDRPVLVDAAVMRVLQGYVPLAPLHQPHNLAGILAAQAAWPGIPQVACFDTAFHRSHPFVNDTFAIPRRFYEEGVRRYGFHGLSYEYIASRLREVAPLHAAGRVVVAHLGNGASMCAMRDGRSICSTMGFTALDGLPMGTRCGQIDPGVLLYLIEHRGMTPAQIGDLLYRESGLKGLSGLSSDMRELEASAAREAGEAIEYFVFRIRRELGGHAAALEGLDAVVFCGGIGEHAWRIREAVLEGMEWLGIELDRAANRERAQLISTARSRVQVFVIPTDEEAMIARHTLALLQESR